jgi:hypothetical protein
MLLRLFAGGAVGMGDQGDGRALVCQLGLRAQQPWNADPSKYVYTTWVSHHWYGEACGVQGSGEPYRSSQLWLLRLAKPITRLLGLPGALDLRALGVICALITGLGVMALVLALPGRLLVRVGIASMIGLAVADSSVAEYFISPYREPAGLLGLMLLCGGLLYLWRQGRSTWPRLIPVAALGIFTITSKPQAIVFLPVVMAAMLWNPHIGLDGAGHWFRLPVGQGPVRWVLRRWPALMACAAMALVSVQYQSHVPKRSTQTSMYNQVFMEILPHSRTRASDLRSLGVDPKLVTSSGADMNDPRSAARQPQYLQFRDKVTRSKVLGFYATHPGRIFSLGSDGGRAMARFRQDALGTYTPGPNHEPGTRECRVCLYTGLFNVTKHQPMLIVGLWLFTLLAGVRVLRESVLGPGEKAVGKLAIVLVASAMAEFWFVMLTEGASGTNMVLTNFLTALCIPVLVLSLSLLLSASRDVGAPLSVAAVTTAGDDDDDPLLAGIDWDDSDDFANVPDTWAEVGHDSS